jgi:hypothetical protein
VELLLGNPSKAKEKLGWKPKYDLQALVADMVESDLAENQGRHVARSYLQNLADAVGSIVQAKEETWHYATPRLTIPVHTVAISLDGTCMVLCEEGYRQAMVGTISLYDRHGERLHTIYEFEMLLRRGAVQYVRSNVCMTGGLTGAKKIAALAEAHYARVVPHNPLGPVSTAACVQLDACIPNFGLQEYPIGEHEAPKNEMVKKPLDREGGFLLVPDAPGIGIELADDAAERHPYRPREVRTRLHVDGSIVDQ